MQHFTDLNEEYLKSLGILDMPADTQIAVVQQIYHILEMKMAIWFSEHLHDDQIEEFQHHADNDEPEVFKKWLKKTVPSYEAAVERSLNEIHSELQLPKSLR